MLELTEEQQQAVETDSAPPRLIDPTTMKTYVLLSSETYDRIRDLLEEDDLNMRQVAALVERAMREDDANDPTLAFYQQHYGRKP